MLDFHTCLWEMCCEVEMFLSAFSFLFLSRHLICIYDLLAHKYLTFLTYLVSLKKKMTWSTFVVCCYLYLLEIKIIFKKSILFDLLLTKSAKTFFKPHPTI